jgi:hypothetical protein
VAWEIYADPREADLHRYREAREGTAADTEALASQGRATMNPAVMTRTGCNNPARFDYAPPAELSGQFQRGR